MGIPQLTRAYYRRTGVVLPLPASPDHVFIAGITKWLLPINAVLFAIFGIGLIALSVVTGDREGAVFALVWTCFMWWIVVPSLVGCPWKLVLDGEYLYWASALRTGRVPLDDLTEIETRRGSGGAIVIRASGERSIGMFAGGPTFKIFGRELTAAAPHVSMRTSYGLAKELGESPEGWSSEPSAVGKRA